MIRLVIETATAACSVAVLDGDIVLAAAHEVVGRGHAERLVPMIGEVLAAANKKRADLILVDCGPGSFTGIRVGLAAARGLAIAWGIEIAGYSAMAVIASRGSGEDVGVAIIGGHGELFVQRFALAPLTSVSELRSMPPAEAAIEVEDETVLGSGATALVTARGSGQAYEQLPNAADAVFLPLALTGLPPIPIYGRAPDAALPSR